MASSPSPIPGLLTNHASGSALRALSAALAHELNTSLATVLAGLSFISGELPSVLEAAQRADDGGLSARARELTEVIAELEAAGRRMAKVVHDLEAEARTSWNRG